MKRRFLPILLLIAFMGISAWTYLPAYAKTAEEAIPVEEEMVDTAVYTSTDNSNDISTFSTVETDESYLNNNIDFCINLYLAMYSRESTFSGDMIIDPDKEVDCQILTNTLMEYVFEHASGGDYLRYHLDIVTASTTYGGSSLHYSAKFTYYDTAEQAQQVNSKINEVIASLDISSASDYEKVKAVYDYICDNVTYDYTHLSDDSYKLKYTAYAALINKTAVCQGYATLFCRFMTELNIPCRCITGEGDGGPHMWNTVTLDGKDYYLDATWDAGRAPESYSYFLKGSSTFKNHAPDDRSQTILNKLKISDNNYVASSEDSDTDEVPSGSFVSGNFTYEYVTSKTIAITNYSGSATDVTVPATIDGHLVHGLNRHAFNDNDKLEILRLSEGIETMDSESITDCSNLKALYLPSSFYAAKGYKNTTSTNTGGIIIETGLSVFPTRCQKLTHIYVDDNNPFFILYNGDVYTANKKIFVFHPNTTATEINIPEGTKCISSSACGEVTNTHLKKVTLPSTLKTIGYWAFYGCEALGDVVIPDSCTDIGQYAFDQTNIKNINIPKDTYVMFPLFSGTVNVTIAEGNAYIRKENGLLICENKVVGYGNDTYPRVLEIPDGVTYIDNLYGVNNDNYTTEDLNNPKLPTYVQQIMLPDSLQATHSYAIWNFYNVKSIVIPKNVEYLGEHSFVNMHFSEITILSEKLSVDNLKSAFPYLSDQVIIYGKKGSSAEAFATAKEVTFKAYCNHQETILPAVAASCASPGKTEGRRCTICGKTTKLQENITVPHSYDDWTITKNPTAIANGEKERTCSTCGNVDTVSIDKLKATIKLSATKKTIKKKKSYTLVISGLAKGDGVKSVATSKKSVAIVKKTAANKYKITAKKKGKATIKVILKSGKTASCTVTVK